MSSASNIQSKLWVLPAKGYGLWGIEDLWVMVCISQPTKLVDGQGYGLKGVMGYQKYGLRGVRLHTQHLLPMNLLCTGHRFGHNANFAPVSSSRCISLPCTILTHVLGWIELMATLSHCFCHWVHWWIGRHDHVIIHETNNKELVSDDSAKDKDKRFTYPTNQAYAQMQVPPVWQDDDENQQPTA